MVLSRKGNPVTESDFNLLEAANRQYLQLPAKDSPRSLVEQLVTHEWSLDSNEREQGFNSCAEVSEIHELTSDDYKLTHATSFLLK